MSKIFKSGRIVVAKVNESGYTIETLCVEIERVTGKPQDKKCERVLYPLLDHDNKYIFENVDIAVIAGLKKEVILKEIRNYLLDKNNYGKQTKKEEKREKKEEYKNEDLWGALIENAVTLEELAQIYHILHTKGIINRYRDKILKKLNKVEFENPFFFTEFNKYSDLWLDENSEYCITHYMLKIYLLLEKYKNIKYDQVIDFNNIFIKKGDYLEELLCNFVDLWRDYNVCYFVSEEENRLFFLLYSKFEYARFNSYVITILFAIYSNEALDKAKYIPEYVKIIFQEIKEKINSRMQEIHFPKLSFDYSYMRALESNNCIDFAKAYFQTISKEDEHYLTLLEEQIKSSNFNIEEALLLILCVFEDHKSKLEWHINIKALTTILDNNNLKNNANFKRIHFLFYESVYYYLTEIDVTENDLKEIRALYQNNCSKYNDSIKNEFENINRYCL